MEGPDEEGSRTPLRKGVLSTNEDLQGKLRTVIDGHGIDHDKTLTMDGLKCKKDGKPFTCLCGDGRFTLVELLGHMKGAEDSLALEAAYCLGVVERAHTLPAERVKEAKARLDELAGHYRPLRLVA